MLSHFKIFDFSNGVECAAGLKFLFFNNLFHLKKFKCFNVGQISRSPY